MKGRAMKIWGTAVSLLLLAATASPLIHGRDSFPLSTFPMFSKARPPIVDIDHVIGIGADGSEEVVPPSLVMRGEVLQTKVAITQAIANRRAKLLCREVASRLAGLDRAVVRVEVRSDRYRVSGYFAGDRRPLETRVHARCRVAP